MDETLEKESLTENESKTEKKSGTQKEPETKKESEITKEPETGKKRKIKKRIIIGVAIFVALNLIAALPVASFVEVQVLKGKGNRSKTTESYTREWVAAECGIDSVEFDETYHMEAVSIQSTAQENYTIPAFHYTTNQADKNGFVVMAHGMNASHITIYPETQAFLDMGFDVWSFDERKCGESDWDTISYGYYEGKDVADVFRYAISQDREISEVTLEDNPDVTTTIIKKQSLGFYGLWGLSLGGAACGNAIDEPGVRENVSFLILDCPVGAMDELTGAPDFQNKLASKISKKVLGYSFDEQSPYNQLLIKPTNVLMLLAGDDTVVPEVSLERLRDVFSASALTYKENVWPGASHASLCRSNPEEYERQIAEFLINDCKW